MKQSSYKVLITTSGTGSRLGNLTKYRNKTLIRVGKKPVISYIIEAYPKNTQFVVTLGHFGKQVKDFLSLAYPNNNFTFVSIDKYQGDGSSLGYSMLQAAPHLQQPFIYNASDTIVTEKIPYPDINWIAGFNGEGSSNYTSFNVLNGKIQRIMDKGIINPDYLHIGLVGIYDFKKFWKTLNTLYEKNLHGDKLGDVHVLNDLIDQGIDFRIKEFKTWHDTGNTEPLRKAQEALRYSFYNLDKLDESIFILNDKKVVKFYFNNQVLKERVKRAKILKGLVPNIESYNNNFFTYRYVAGELYSAIANPTNFSQLLQWAEKKLWKPKNEVSDKEFKKTCYVFYHDKTLKRIEEFLKTRGVKDDINIINDEEVPIIKEMIKKIDFEWLCKAKQTGFHGDFIPDNIIKTKKGFCLLDWRNNFGGLLQAGDLYYDLAKLNHNLIINHQIVADNLFTIKITGKKIACDIYRKENLVQCQKVLDKFIKDHSYDEYKIKILTSFVWLNSSPLHHHPYDAFLYYFAKLNLWRTINGK
jgi:choline kinase